MFLKMLILIEEVPSHERLDHKLMFMYISEITSAQLVLYSKQIIHLMICSASDGSDRGRPTAGGNAAPV